MDNKAPPNPKRIFEDVREEERVIKEKNHTKNGDHPPEDQPKPREEERLRPGVSNEFLRRHNIRHVGKEESSELIGYQAPGIAIPYTNTDGSPLIVNRRSFHRIRLDVPTNAKYLSPKGSGAQLFIPQNQIYGAELVIAESEFKAAALAEAGVPTVGIGGICSAMTEGKLIPELEHLIAKHPPAIVFFLGDADTCFISAFSIEAIKMAKALPKGCQLKLPRIPITMPNGIDDCREKLGEGFAAVWKEIKDSALLIDPDLPFATLAVRLATRELPAIANFPDREIQIRRLTVMASYLPAIELDTLAREVNKILKIGITAFRQNVKQIGDQRRKQEAESQHESQRQNAGEAVNDPRPKLEIPGSRDRLSSEFADELGPILAKHEFFLKDKVVVIPDVENACLIPALPAAFRTKIENYIIPFKVLRAPSGYVVSFNRSIPKEEAETILQSEHLARHLSKIRAVNNVRLPVFRLSGHIELLPEGYDPESMIYTMPGGPQIEDCGAELAREFLLNLLKEFCFREGDEKRARAVAIAAMLTLFNFSILPRGSLRPAFLNTANAEGSGKTLLARIAIIPRTGVSPTGPLPEKDEEIEKRVFAAALSGSPVLFFDNAKRHISNAALESALTSHYIQGRILGLSKNVDVENMMTVFITGNGATISPDLRRRTLQIELHLKEARAEDRVIKNPLNDAALIKMRSEILSALWSITLDWEKTGRPLSDKLMSNYEPWSAIIGGILEHNGFGSPCEPNPAAMSGDRDTIQMITLVTEMVPKKDYTFADLVTLAQQLDLFASLLGDGSDGSYLEKKERSIFSAILKRFVDRKFPNGRVFHHHRPSKNLSFYYVNLE